MGLRGAAWGEGRRGILGRLGGVGFADAAEGGEPHCGGAAAAERAWLSFRLACRSIDQQAIIIMCALSGEGFCSSKTKRKDKGFCDAAQAQPCSFWANFFEEKFGANFIVACPPRREGTVERGTWVGSGLPAVHEVFKIWTVLVYQLHMLVKNI